MACCLAADGLSSPMGCWPISASISLSSFSTGEFARFVSQPNIYLCLLWIISPGRLLAGQQRGYFSVCVVWLVVEQHLCCTCWGIELRLLCFKWKRVILWPGCRKLGSWGILPRSPVQNPFANSLQSSGASSLNPTKSKIHKPFLFPDAPNDKWKQDMNFDSFYWGCRRGNRMTRKVK